MRLWTPAAAALVVLAVPSLAQAHFDFGHQAVGDIAFTRLSPKAKAEVRKMLMAGDPRFRPTDNTDAALRKAFRDMTTWADIIKGDRKSVYEQMIVQANKTYIPSPDPNEYEQHHCRSWHYYNTPIRANGNTPNLPKSNAISAMGLVKKNLASEKDSFKRAFWLYWAGHIVGDLHQPLHCVSDHKYIAAGDRGGNDFEVAVINDYNGRNYKLHAFWDGGIDAAADAEGAKGLPVDFPSLTKRWTQQYPEKSFGAELKVLDAAAWVKDGAVVAEKYAYAGITPGGKPSQSYIDQRNEISKKRAVLAGYRLAAFLNELLK